VEGSHAARLQRQRGVSLSGRSRASVKGTYIPGEGSAWDIRKTINLRN
jgi:hypothetical protein